MDTLTALPLAAQALRPGPAMLESSKVIYAWTLAAGIGGFLIALGLVPAAFWAAARFGGHDPVDPSRKVHSVPIARTGGICLIVPFLVAGVLVTLFLGDTVRGEALLKEWGWMLLGCLAMFALGFADDLHPLGARLKLLFQIAICGVVAIFGFKPSELSVGFATIQFDLATAAIPVAFLWLLATTNLVNLIDGIDGLAAGISLFVFAVLAAAVGFSGGGVLLVLCALMIGALLAFLLFNFPPARIFLGDGGAYFLGFLIGQMGLAAEHKSTIAAAVLVPIAALGIPILDTTLAIVRRAIRGLPIFRADREHIHHRLLDLGLSPRRVVLGLYAACVICCLLGFLLFVREGKGLILALGVVFTLAVLAVWRLGYVRDGRVFFQLTEALRHRSRTSYIVEICRLLRFEARLHPDPLAFWTEFCVALRKGGFSRARFRPEPPFDLPALEHESGPADNDLAFTFPILVRKVRVGALELAPFPGDNNPRVVERHAGLFRDSLADALRDFLAPAPAAPARDSAPVNPPPRPA